MTKDFFEKSERKHLMLIDGNSLINRAYYAGAGRTLLTNSEGVPSGAVYTFLNMFLNYREKIQPDHIIVAFDLKDKTFRHEMYDAYKGTRKGMPEDLAVQIPLLKEMLDALNVCRVEKSGYEADDLIGTYARLAVADNFDVYIVTGDKDSYQLIRDHVFVVLPVTRAGSKTENLMDREAFVREYHFQPEQFVDYKALMGDSSDNIPGVSGIGKVSAGDLIKNHHSLENIYRLLEKNPDSIPTKYRGKLTANKEIAELSYRLALIETQVPVELDLSASAAREPDQKALSAYFNKMGFQSMFDRFELKNEESLFSAEDIEELREIKEPDEFIKLAHYKNIVWLVNENAHSLLYSKDVGYLLLEPMQLQLEWDNLSNLSNNIIVWDYKNWLHTLDLGPLKVQPFDVQIAAYLLNQGKAEDFGSVYQSVYQEYFPQTEKKASPAAILKNDLKMAIALNHMHDLQRQLIRDNQMSELAYQIEMPLTRILADMEKLGVLADKEQLDNLNILMNQEISELEQRIYDYAGEKFNINSSQQLSDILFNRLSLKKGKKLASGYYSTAAKELERLQGDHPIIDLILEHRELSKLNSTFVDGLRKSIDPRDGRIHTTYHQTLTSTGRLSSSDPNLQNIPVRSERSKAIREVFVAKPGYLLLGADYSQIELRLLAHFSGDEHLIEAFSENQDIHRRTAMKIFQKPADKITRAERSLAKTVNFSIIYGVSAYGLAQDLKSSNAAAAEYIKAYYELYDKVKPYLESIIEFAKENDYVETLYGRRRYIPELKSSQFFTRSFGERAAMNAPLQGTAADIIKLAMIKVDRLLRQNNLLARIILQVHDELILEVPESEIDEVSRILKEGMENVVELKVPLLAEVERGKSWADI